MQDDRHLSTKSGSVILVVNGRNRISVEANVVMRDVADLHYDKVSVEALCYHAGGSRSYQ